MPARRKGSAGFTLVEVMVAMLVLAITVGGITTALATSFSLSRENRERGQALDAAHSLLETLASEPEFSEIFLRYNATTADDPALGASPGSTFSVLGLTVRRNDPDGFVGSVSFPGDGVALLENVVDRDLGMPRDLDGSGLVEAGVDQSDDYRVLPVRVRIEWTGAGGAASVEVVTTLAPR